LACMCDMRIAAESARFAESFVKVGIVPGDGGAWLLPRVVGFSKACEMAFTGDMLNAAEALACGLVSRGAGRRIAGRGLRAGCPHRGESAACGAHGEAPAAGRPAYTARYIAGDVGRHAGADPCDCGPPGSGGRVPGEAEAKLPRGLINPAPA